MPSPQLRQSLDEACRTYYQMLRGSAAVPYLQSRGLSGDSAVSFRLGYVDDPLPGHEQYRGRLCIPYLTRAGVVSLRFRRLAEDDGPKYLGLPGDTLRVFNPAALHIPGPEIGICEGELDAITATQAGIPSVGIPGVQALKSYTPRMFRGYDRVWIFADNDDKGQGQEFAERLAGLVDNARVVTMPAGDDVNSMVVSRGEAALRDMIGA